MDEYENERKILKKLKAGENIFLVIVATVIGLVPMFTLLGFLTSGVRLPLFLLVVPGAMVGLSVRFIARPISAKLRLIPTATVFFVMVAYGVFFLVTPTFYVIAVANIFVVLLTSKRRFNKEEDRALWLEERGKISL